MIEQLLKRVYDRCIEDEHGCMNWTGAVQSGCKSPVMRRGNAHGSSLRRWILEESQGQKIPQSKVATYTCGNSKCVKLEHLMAVTRAHIQRRNDAKFDAATRLRKSHRIVVKVRAKAKLSVDIAREIREAEGPQRAIARRYGVSQATVGSIKRGVTWREVGVTFWGVVG